MINIVLSFLALFAGIVSLFTDVEKPRGKIFAGVLGLTLFATFGVQIYQQNQTEKEAKQEQKRVEQEKNEAKEEIKWQREQITNLTTTLSNFKVDATNSLNELKDLIALSTSFGSVEKNPTIKSLQQSIEADQARTQLSKSTDSTQRNQITVQYFPKNVDGNIVKSSLKELGFEITLGKPGIPDVPTNALFYGDKVPLDDVKLVALTLIRAGVEIKHIRLFHDSTGRESLIQVGSGTAYISKPPYSVEAIQQATKFPL